jgi:predicted DNA binding protein
MIKITDEILQHYLEKISDLLVNGEVINHVTNSTHTTTLKDADGNVLRTITKSTETRKTTILPTPAYVHGLVERSASTESAIELLMRQGYVVIDPTVAADKESQQSKGLSDEAVNLIKAKLLGIEPD